MFLLGVHSRPTVAAAAEELLRQGVVLVWSAFEVLAQDVFEAVVNARPDLGKSLLDSPEGRRLFQVKAIDLDTLAKFSFDLSGRMGSVLSEFRDMSDLAAIKSVVNGLFPGRPSLSQILGSKQLWYLSQQRHLIVHNRGVVDRRYVERTGTTLGEGTQLRVQPSDLEEYVGVVRDAAAEVLTAARDVLGTPSTPLKPAADQVGRG